MQPAAVSLCRCVYTFTGIGSTVFSSNVSALSVLLTMVNRPCIINVLVDYSTELYRESTEFQHSLFLGAHIHILARTNAQSQIALMTVLVLC